MPAMTTWSPSLPFSHAPSLAVFKTQSQEHFQEAFPSCPAHCHWERYSFSVFPSHPS